MLRYMEVKRGIAGADLRGTSLRTTAGMFQEFHLSLDQELVLSLKYVFNPIAEEQGAICFQCTYDLKHWELLFYRSALLQIESYRLLCNGAPVATFSGRWAFLPAKLTFVDGTTFTCVRGFYRTTVRDPHGAKTAIASLRWTGSLQGSSVINVERTADTTFVAPLLLILLHLSTHHSN